MWAKSEGPGKGSTFFFTIRARSPTCRRTSRRDFIGKQPGLRGKRVLVVDDNATNRKRAGAADSEVGHGCRATRSRPKRRCGGSRQGEAFDLAILDMHMPEMDGLTLAQQIRGIDATLPLVLFSSLGRREIGDIDGLFTAYLAKPIRQSQLFDTLVSLLAHDEAPKPRRRADQADARPRHGRAPSAAHPAGRGQRGQPEARDAAAAADGLPGGPRIERYRGDRVRAAPALRRRADGRADAGDGRARGVAPDHGAMAARTNGRASWR